MQNIFTRVKVKIAEGVGIEAAAAKGERDLQKFNTVSCFFATRNFSAAAFQLFSLFSAS